MRGPRGAGVMLAALAFALGLSACGGTKHTATKPSAATIEAANAHWRAGLGRWRHSMLEALDGISLLFSTETTLADLQAIHSHATLRLAAFESTLTNCDEALARIGPAPPSFALSGRYASRACKNLELGERMVEQAVRQMKDNTLIDPMDPLHTASGPLSTGQQEIVTASAALAPEPT
ncbi:MAG TPA: hypothetical protein VG265_01560 [Gaiellaceae bacterium]|nr:hypothetical protein [Gaiellaceae bacterium]